MSSIGSGVFFCRIFAAFLLFPFSWHLLFYTFYSVQNARTWVRPTLSRIRLIKILAPRLTSCLAAILLVTHSVDQAACECFEINQIRIDFWMRWELKSLCNLTRIAITKFYNESAFILILFVLVQRPIKMYVYAKRALAIYDIEWCKFLDIFYSRFYFLFFIIVCKLLKRALKNFAVFLQQWMHIKILLYLFYYYDFIFQILQSKVV